MIQRLVLAWAFALGLFLVPSLAWAEGRLLVAPANGAVGLPLQLLPAEGALRAEARLRNAGDAAVVIYRIAVHGDADDVRAPLGVRIKHEPLPLSIAPGEERTFGVEWAPEAGGPTQAMFHVVVTSTDEQAGELALGVRGDTRPWYQGFTLSLFALVCFLGALIVAAARRDNVSRYGPLVVAAVTLLLSALVAKEFNPSLGVAQGNDGLQLIERASVVPSLGVEYFVAADASTPVLLLAVALLFCLQTAALPSSRPLAAASRVMAFGLFFHALVGRDLYGIWLSAFAALSFGLVAVASARPTGLYAVLRLGGAWAAAAGLALLAVSALHHGTGASFSLAGARTAHTSVLPELARMSFQAGHTQLLGLPLPRFVFVCATLSVVLIACVPPVHLSFLAVAQEGEAPELSTLGLLRTIGLLMLIRVWCILLPDAAMWAEGGLCGAGAAATAFAALGALGTKDHRRRWAQLGNLDLGLALAAIGTQTPAGVTAGLLTIMVGPLAASAVLAVAPGRFSFAAEPPKEPLRDGAPLVFLALAAFIALPGTLLLARDHAAVRALLPAHVGLLVLAGTGAAIGRLGALWSLPDLLNHSSPPARLWGRGALSLSLALVVFLGVYPQPVLGPVAQFAESALRVPR